MKLIGTLIASALVAFGTVAQVPVKLSGKLFNSSSKTIALTQNVDGKYVDVASAKLDKDGQFTFSTKIPQSDYFLLKVNEGVVYLILREKSDIQVFGDAKQLGKHVNIVNSDESAALNSFTYIANDWNVVKNNALKEMQANPAKQDSLNNVVMPIFKEFQSEFQKFYAEQQATPAIIAVLSVIDPMNEHDIFQNVAASLNTSFPQSSQVKQIVRSAQELKKEKEAANKFAPGKEAPDFEELMLDRKTTMKLSDLRGKVVLLDFWAAWCGPCRRENPNVVKVYNNYKDKGFTVMNVSLDGDLESWKKAIEQDGLIWPNHVSDLKKWQSAVGRLYGVNSIPFTVLIDQEGKIIGTNLRGAALEEAVSKILDK